MAPASPSSFELPAREGPERRGRRLAVALDDEHGIAVTELGVGAVADEPERRPAEPVAPVKAVEQARLGQLDRRHAGERAGGEADDGHIVRPPVRVEIRVHGGDTAAPRRHGERMREVVGEDAWDDHRGARAAGLQGDDPFDVRRYGGDAVGRREEVPAGDHGAAAQQRRWHRARSVDVEAEHADIRVAVAVGHAPVDGRGGRRERQQQERGEQGGELHGRDARRPAYTAPIRGRGRTRRCRARGARALPRARSGRHAASASSARC